MIFLLVMVFTGYCGLIVSLIFGFNKLKTFEYQESIPLNKFSVIVPFRDEANNLPVLIESFLKLDYPKNFFEIILVDDDLVESFALNNLKLTLDIDIQVIKNIRKTNSPKKDAISTAITVAKNNWIVTTDADCVAPEKWLMILDAFIQKTNAEMVAGAVVFKPKKGFLSNFQQLDLASLQGVTMGSFGLQKGFMCNGANFAYTKKMFFSLNGFFGNDKIASGDDVFLLQKAMKQFPEKVFYLKSKLFIIQTESVANWTKLFFQRVRWASKATAYNSFFGKMASILVLLTTVFFIFGWLWGKIWMVCVFCKLVVDFILISKTNDFLNRKNHSYLISSFVYPPFSFAVGVYSLFGKYDWKGRRF
jgi:glycosyltransferase involved in cell wall biosynthesis